MLLLDINKYIVRIAFFVRIMHGGNRAARTQNRRSGFYHESSEANYGIRQVLHLPNLDLDESNACRVIFFDGYAVDFEALPDKDELYLIAELGPVPTDAACLHHMREASLYGFETGGAKLGIDPDREGVIMHGKLDISVMDYPRFEQQLEVFFDRLKSWKGNYREAPGTAEPLTLWHIMVLFSNPINANKWSKLCRKSATHSSHKLITSTWNKRMRRSC